MIALAVIGLMLLLVMLVNTIIIAFNLDLRPEAKPEEDENAVEYNVAEAWRGINLAVGEGHSHNEACCELADLRAAGWHIEKSGNERAGWVYLKLIAPGYKEGA